jgi:hypothetical protein
MIGRDIGLENSPIYRFRRIMISVTVVYSGRIVLRRGASAKTK